MKKLIFFLCFWVFPACAQTVYVAGSEDVPLMDGLVHLPDMDMTFDAPEGRIVQTTAYSETLSPKEVKAFYAESLPQLGWKCTGREFVRENETLSVETHALKGKTTVRFELKSN